MLYIHCMHKQLTTAPGAPSFKLVYLREPAWPLAVVLAKRYASMKMATGVYRVHARLEGML